MIASRMRSAFMASLFMFTTRVLYAQFGLKVRCMLFLVGIPFACLYRASEIVSMFVIANVGSFVIQSIGESRLLSLEQQQRREALINFFVTKFGMERELLLPGLLTDFLFRLPPGPHLTPGTRINTVVDFVAECAKDNGINITGLILDGTAPVGG